MLSRDQSSQTSRIPSQGKTRGKGMVGEKAIDDKATEFCTHLNNIIHICVGKIYSAHHTHIVIVSSMPAPRACSVVLTIVVAV